MAKCDYCGSMILFGGTKAGDKRFCNARCHQSWQLIQVSSQLAPESVHRQVWEVHQGLCPVCKGQGPVDVHTAHQVWSAVLITQWKSLPRLSCRACGVKHQVSNLAICLVAGWWGFPWGLIVTPVQVIRNLGGMMHGPDPLKPSEQLEKIVRMSLGRRVLATQATPART
ncbi:MAG TPA: hypothetical protein VF173_03905 [Thermoanaerobaculia bacterium]|nr:hypothetical protein [Thermoanaerobaculia bacterium]